MTQLVPIRRALLSVSDKQDLVAFARGLADLGVEIVSTGGTARALTEAGLTVIPVEAVTGMPEMMDGRVKTLHPAIHGALLGRRDLEAHRRAMNEHGITPIDLVCVNLYPFERTIADDSATPEACIEQIDIGGPAILRSAAKNHEFVTVVTAPVQYDHVMNELHRHEGATTLELRRELAAAAFSRTAQYELAISAWMGATYQPEFPHTLRLTYSHALDLRYGENPHQSAALYHDPTSAEPSIVTAEARHGKPLSYNNINDADAALDLVRELSGTAPELSAAAIIKHTNPCGAAIAPALHDAFEAAYAGDPLAAYGGILALSRPIDRLTASAIAEGQRFLEVIVAPDFSDEATAILSKRWQNVRLLAVAGMAEPSVRRLEHRSIAGGALVQQRDNAVSTPEHWTHVAGPEPDAATRADALFTWIVAKHLKSNAIAIGVNQRLLGAGPGQVDRVTACRIAIEKAGDRIRAAGRAVAASDAFFPFADGPKALIDAGATCLVHPGGSKRDEETFALCNERGVTCLVTGMRHFRH